MHRYLVGRILGAGLVMLLFVAGVLARQAPPSATDAGAKAPVKRAIRAEDYAAWESLGGASLSPDGRWLAYGILRADGDREMRLRMLATETTEAIPHAARPQFSKDGKWLAYAVGVSEAEREKTEKSKEAARSKVVVRNLVSGETATVDEVATAGFSDNGKFLVMRRYPIKGRESAGTDLVVRDLATGVDTSFGNVASYAFNDRGTLLALLIDAEGKVGNGIQVYDTATGLLRTLDSAAARYTALDLAQGRRRPRRASRERTRQDRGRLVRRRRLA